MPTFSAAAPTVSRRTFLSRLAALAGLLPALQADATPLFSDPKPFTLDLLRKRAKTLAEKPLQAPSSSVSKALRDLSGQQYHDIRYRPQEALWLGDAAFTAQFFHPGYYYKTAVRVFDVTDDQAREVRYAPALFDFGGNTLGPGALEKTDGFAGVRIHYALNTASYLDELISFLGGSYFRALGRNMGYGLSARGLAIGTASEQGEEFPFFSEFYLERPVDANSLVLHALLDSRSCTGVYTFTVRPGESTIVDVNLTLYTRLAMDTVGIAPLTSMFFFAANDRQGVDDYREQVHDSDGLLVCNGGGEWLWRPLVNPQRLRVSYFVDHNPKGFGLLQRNRRFESYEDADSHYENRPSAWVEPVGDWGAGAVTLVEIPSDRESNDNIVAFWRPKEPLAARSEWQATYRLHWCRDVPVAGARLGSVVSTRVGRGSQEQSRLFIVDFGGDALHGLNAPVKTQLFASRGQLSTPSTRWVEARGIWRTTFELVPEGEDPIELRCVLMASEQAITESWCYQWTL
ncbi:MAG: glucan biosynthesis protein G [Gammaproteobacteria bacterium]|nr:glucan biosynthesis protein G [Gammaproteobacteria bacterium]